MSKIRSRDTKIEKVMYSPLIEMGLEYHLDGIEGKPEFVHKGEKVAIFLDGCYWHACTQHCRLPKTNREFWLKKFIRNRKRDREVTAKLVSEGWLVIRVWGHMVKKDLDHVVETVRKALKGRKALDNKVGGVRYL